MYKLLYKLDIKTNTNDFVCTFINKFNNKTEEIKENEQNKNIQELFGKNINDSKLIGKMNDSAIIYYDNVLQEYRKTLFDYEYIKKLNVFFNYKEISMIEYPSGKIVLHMQRKEYSLINYKTKDIKNNIKEHIFYDIIFINQNKLYHSISTKENERLTEKEFNQLVTNKEKTKCIIDFENKTQNNFKKQSWFIFEYGKHLFIKDNQIINLKETIHKLDLDLNEQQFCKIYNPFFIFKIKVPKNYFDFYKYQLSTYKEIDYNKLFYHNELFKTFIVNELSLPKSFLLINKLNVFLKCIHFPAIENTWNHFSLLNDSSYINYCHLINDNTLTLKEDYDINDYLNKDLKSITYKDLQKKSLLYKKKTNQLLKDKINIEINEDNINTHHFFYTLLYLFSNVDHLNNLINLLPKMNYSFNSYDLECYIKIPYEDIDSSDFEKFNLFNMNDTYKGSDCDKNKEIQQKINKLIESNDIHYYEYINTLSSYEIKELLLKFFKNEDILEKAILDFFKTNINKMHFIECINHFYDIIKIIYLIDYKHTYNKFNEKESLIIFQFYENKYSNFILFEEDIYKLENILQEKELNKNIPTLPLNYTNYKNGYYFKQPSNGFELKYVGNHMHHCVFSYFHDLLKPEHSNQYVVVLYDKGNNPVVCLEILNKENILICTQAKMKYNKSIFKDKNLMMIVLNFLNRNNIDISSNDFKEHYYTE